MNIDFDNIFEHTIPMDKFQLKWRCIDHEYGILPEHHLEQLKPLNYEASLFLWDYIATVGLHDEIPFKKDLFRTIDKAKILDDNKEAIKKWLYRRGFAFEKMVFLSWQPNCAMIVPWKLLIKYFDFLYYHFSDDLTVIDQSLNWALLFYHENEVYFGTNQTFKTNYSVNDIDFIWS